MSEKSKKLAVGAVVGAAAGFVAGILMAPKSGKETRADLKKGAKEAVKATDQQLKKLQSELNDLVDKAESKLSKITDSAKAEAVKALENAKKVRSQSASVVAAMKSGNSSDEDLDLAVKNAKNAVDSLKKYFSK